MFPKKAISSADIEISASLPVVTNEELESAITGLQEDIAAVKRRLARPGTSRDFTRLQAMLEHKNKMLSALFAERERRGGFFKRNWPLLAAVPLGVGTGLLTGLNFNDPATSAVMSAIPNVFAGSYLGLLQSALTGKSPFAPTLLGMALAGLPAAVTGGITSSLRP